MNSRSAILSTLYAITLSLCVFSTAPPASAQGLDPAMLLNPPTDTWPTYNGDYSGRRYSTLDQINAGNVNSLTLAWIYRTPTRVLKSTPLVVTASCISLRPTMFGPSTRNSAAKSGTISVNPEAITSAIVASPCTKTGSTSNRPTHI